MSNQTLLQAYELTLFATQFLERIERALVLLENAESTEERSWLTAGRLRVSRALTTTQAKLKSAQSLPELVGLREEAAAFHLGRWVDSLEHLLSELTRELAENAPLIEVLFPHQKFTAVRRGGKSSEQFSKDFETRVTSSYVTRIAADEEYKFLPPLLAAVRDEHEKWREAVNPPEIEVEDAEMLKAEGLEAARELELTLKQARLLADAALIEIPGAFEELGFNAQPKRRAPRTESRKPPAAEKSAAAE
jgi:hypothetical protein